MTVFDGHVREEGVVGIGRREFDGRTCRRCWCGVGATKVVGKECASSKSSKDVDVRGEGSTEGVVSRLYSMSFYAAMRWELGERSCLECGCCEVRRLEEVVVTVVRLFE